MNDPARTLLELLAIHRGHVANYERQKALVRFDSSLELQLAEERRQVARIKRKLRELGAGVADDPLDGPLDDPPDRARSRRWRDLAPREPGGEPPASSHIGWALAVLAVTLSLAGSIAYVLRDVAASVAVFVFAWLVLGVVLPYAGLQTRRLSSALWFRSYVATLRKIPGLSLVLRRHG